MRISHFGAFAFFVAVTLIEFLIPLFYNYFDYYTNVFVYSCAAINLVFAIYYGKYYVFTEKGIQHKFLGICFRWTPWDRIRDIMFVYQQTGERGRPKTLMFTTLDGIVYRPDESGYIKQKGFMKEWFLGKMFMIRCNDKTRADRIFSYIEKYYGPIDYRSMGDE